MDQNYGIGRVRRVGNPLRIATARLGHWLYKRRLAPVRVTSWMTARWVHQYEYEITG